MKDPVETSYPEVDQQPRYPSIEEEIIGFWREDRTFEASVAQHPPESEYVFYDGPPFANGLPHYGHILTGFVKDTVPRYQTMRGRRVERRFGWDCHGLPAEMEAERELGVSGHAAIAELGVGIFNDRCRTIVQRTTDAWEWYVARMARWVDFEDDYRTMDLTFMESVLWAFKQLYDKGLAYEGYRVLPYCWECETPLSHSETRQDDAYRERTDPAITVVFALRPAPGEPFGDPAEPPLEVLAWTTTPWTLPSNLALAVGPDIEYEVLERDGRRLVLGAQRREAYAEALEGAERIGTLRGADLVGRRYQPLFPFFEDTPRAFVVLAGDFVSTEEGTGVVHMAPGFGEDDQRACESAGIPVVVPVDERGRFTAEVAAYAGQHVFEANSHIKDDLRESGRLVTEEDYVHSYPHCWRTDTPLIYRALTSWFVEVTKFRERMVELNRQITWAPEHMREGAFGKWLEGARDWSITRNRFWGTPIPVWKSDDARYPRVDVYGSLDELERDFGVRPSDLHRPAIDELTRPNPDDPTGRSVMRRVPDVFDCWFESGSMPFAQLHYPFENVERFEEHFPADFIVEYVGQTRGWFYTLHVLATALFDCPPFRNCLAHGILLGNDGRKLSKRLRNYPDPEEVFSSHGADAMRWGFLSSAVLRGLDIVVDARAFSEPVRQVLNPIWNTWSFLTLYGRLDGTRGRIRTDQSGLLDRYALAKTRVLVEQVTAAMDVYDIAGACAAVTSYLDALTNWYVRRSRHRFWRAGGEGAGGDKADAYDTLHTVLSVLCRVLAPLLPFLSEEIYRGLTGERSVHLTEWPSPDELPADPDLVAQMDLVREICSEGHSIRKANGLRARLPLPALVVAAPDAPVLQPYQHLIEEELNVKDVIFRPDVTELATEVLVVVPSVLGPRFARDGRGDATQRVIAGAKQAAAAPHKTWTLHDDGRAVIAGEQLEPGEFEIRLRPRDERVARPLPGHRGVVELVDLTTPKLEAEGVARDVVRVVQQLRKDLAFQVSDRIRTWLVTDDPMVRDVVSTREWADYISEQTLTVEGGLQVVEPAASTDEFRLFELPEKRTIGIHLKVEPAV